MAGIEGFRIKNYRALKDISLGKLWNSQHTSPLSNMTAVIGKNGVGKSTIFDAFGFLADLVLPRFNGQVVKPPAYTTIDTMNRQRRRFTTEQKAEAVGLCLRENLSILEASKRLGVHASCLGRWVKQAQIDQGGLKDSGPLTSDERIEFTRLRKENRELRREKDFFRLAAAHFAKEQLSQRGFQ
jgi:transposase